MEGFITETHWEYIEEVYPGLREFYDELDTKPKTFLELFAHYQRYLTDRQEEVKRIDRAEPRLELPSPKERE